MDIQVDTVWVSQYMEGHESMFSIEPNIMKAAKNYGVTESKMFCWVQKINIPKLLIFTGTSSCRSTFIPLIF